MNRIHGILDPVVLQYLQAEGFTSSGKLTWIRNNDAPIRQMFAFRQWNGGCIAPAWGLSLDFVPHLSGSAFKWHRTPKSALFDITIDSRISAWDIRYYNGEQIILNKGPDMISAAVPQAVEFWNQFNTIASLPAAVAFMRAHVSGGSRGFYQYTQASLAAAFIYAVNKQTELASAEMDQYLSTHDLSQKAADQLQNLFANAHLSA